LHAECGCTEAVVGRALWAFACGWRPEVCTASEATLRVLRGAQPGGPELIWTITAAAPGCNFLCAGALTGMGQGLPC